MTRENEFQRNTGLNIKTQSCVRTRLPRYRQWSLASFMLCSSHVTRYTTAYVVPNNEVGNSLYFDAKQEIDPDSETAMWLGFVPGTPWHWFGSALFFLIVQADRRTIHSLNYLSG